MAIKIALAGNPNCGKTTLFNSLTGSNQYVGNWPGVTVEKKEGKLKGHDDVVIQDLPGIYSLSPYTLEEVVARGYLVNEKPDAILNIIDGTNIERNLYLTTQLIELGIPVVMAVNMIDLVRKNGDKIDLKKLSNELGCEAIEISALKNEGSEKAAELAVAAAKKGKAGELPHVFTGSVEHAIAHIEESIQGKVDDRFLRWYAVKLFERDDKVQAELNLNKELLDHIDAHITDCEKEMDDDAESIITNQRYAYINGVVDKAVKKKPRTENLTVSDKVDQFVTNRILALPIFALIMWLMYAIAMGTSVADGGIGIGTFATDWTNDVLFGEIVPNALGGLLESIGDLVKDKRIEGISDLNDESSSRTGMKIVIEIKKDANPQVVLNQLYRFTQLQDTVGVIMLALDDGVPKIMSLKTMMERYIEFQMQVIRRRTAFELKKAKEREHILEGLHKAVDIVDEIIATIRACKGGFAEARQAVMDNFGFDELQADAIVKLQLGRLAGLEILKIEQELGELREAIADYEDILANDEHVKRIVKTDLTALADKYGLTLAD